MNDERIGDLANVDSILANWFVILSAVSLTSIDFGLKTVLEYYIVLSPISIAEVGNI